MKNAMLSGALIFALTNGALAESLTHKTCDIQIMNVEKAREVLGEKNVATLIHGLKGKGYSYTESSEDAVLTLIIDDEERAVEIRGDDDVLSDSESDGEFTVTITEMTFDDFLGGKLRYRTSYDPALPFAESIQHFLGAAPDCVKGKKG